MNKISCGSAKWKDQPDRDGLLALYREINAHFLHQDEFVWRRPTMAFAIVSAAVIFAYQTTIALTPMIRSVALLAGAVLLSIPLAGLIKHREFAGRASIAMFQIEEVLGLPHFTRPFTKKTLEGHALLDTAAAGQRFARSGIGKYVAQKGASDFIEYGIIFLMILLLGVGLSGFILGRLPGSLS